MNFAPLLGTFATNTLFFRFRSFLLLTRYRTSPHASISEASPAGFRSPLARTHLLNLKTPRGVADVYLS